MPQLVKKFQHFMEPEGTLPCSQKSATCPYPEPSKSSLHPPSPTINSDYHFPSLTSHQRICPTLGLFEQFVTSLAFTVRGVSPSPNPPCWRDHSCRLLVLAYSIQLPPPATSGARLLHAHPEDRPCRCVCNPLITRSQTFSFYKCVEFLD